MAAIFQLRRGTTAQKPTLTAGELYVDQTSENLIVGVNGSKEITLLKLNDINTGSLTLTGDIRLSGSIYLGDSVGTDNIAALGLFTTNLVPSPDNSIDIGTTSAKWRNVYATNLYGAVNATNGVISGSSQLTSLFEEKASATHTLVSGSSQVIEILQSLNSFSQSANIRLGLVETSTGSLNQFTSSTNTRLGLLEVSTGSLNEFTSSQLTQNTALATITGSLISTASNHEGRLVTLENTSDNSDDKFTAIATITGSLILTASNHEIRLDEIESYTSSLKNAITVTGVDTNSLTTIRGDFRVLGTSSVITSQHIHLDDNIIELNGTGGAFGGFLVRDLTGGSIVSGSLKWNTYLDRWEAGKDAGDNTEISKILLAGGDGIISSSLQLTELNSFTESTNTRLGLLETSTGSLNTFSGSTLSRLTNIEASTGSLNTFTSSTNTRLGLIETSTGSLNTFSESVNVRLGLIETSTGSLNSFSSSTLSRLVDLEESTASLNMFTSSTSIRLNLVETSTGSLNTFTSSTLIRLELLETSTGSLNQFTGSQLERNTNLATITGSLIISSSQSYISSSLMTASVKDHEERLTYLEGIGGISGGNPLTQLHIFSASAKISIANLESFTSSIDTTIKNKLNIEGVVSGSPQVLITDLDGFADYNDSIMGEIGQKLFTSSFNEYTASQSTGSLVTSISNLNNATSSYETKGRGIVSGSSQIVPLLPTGVISGSIQILGGSGVWSSSVQMPAGVVSGSSQILGGSGLFSSSAQIGNYVAIIAGTENQVVVAGSGLNNASVTLSTPQSIATTSNVQFNSLGIGTTASTTTGEIRATGDITAYYSSDERLKENIQPIENALQKVNQISGNTYDWKEGYDEVHSHKGNDVGVIAQEIEQILPQIVTNRDNGYKAVQYEKIIPLLIQAIKELSVKIEVLENK
jgi:hypothetical protein